MTKIKQINIKTIFQMYFSYHNFHYTVSKINAILSVGVTDQGAHTNIYVGPRAESKKEPLLDQVWPRTKGTAYY